MGLPNLMIPYCELIPDPDRTLEAKILAFITLRIKKAKDGDCPDPATIIPSADAPKEVLAKFLEAHKDCECFSICYRPSRLVKNWREGRIDLLMPLVNNDPFWRAVFQGLIRGHPELFS